MIARHTSVDNKGGTESPEEPEALRLQYEAYRAALEKRKWWERDEKFGTFEAFRDADPSERRAEFKKLGIAEPWTPRSSTKETTAVRGKR